MRTANLSQMTIGIEEFRAETSYMAGQNNSPKPSARRSHRSKLGVHLDPLHESESVLIATAAAPNFTKHMSYADIPVASPIRLNANVGKAAPSSRGPDDVSHSACKPVRPKLTDHIFGEYETVEFRYVLKEVLGDGMLGVVRRCVEKDSGIEWACKTIKKCQMVHRDDIEAVRNEVATMMELSEHFVIASLHDVVEDDEVHSRT